MATIYYGRTAYEAVAKELGNRLGVQVSVVDGASACVDAAGAINLPGMNKYQTREEFEHTCTTIVHEIAHVFYGSNVEFASHAARERLWRDCLNAVLDVADETGIGDYERANGNTRPEYLLLESNRRAWNDNYRSYTDLSHPCPHWQILATGIIRARLYPNRGGIGMSRDLRNRFAGKVDVTGAHTILKSARKFPRHIGAHGQLIRLADKLAAKLAPLAPPPTAPETPSGFEIVPNAFETARETGEDSVPTWGIEATDAQGATFADNTSPGYGAGGNCESNDGATESSAHTRDLLLPIVRRIADRIATDGDSLTRDGGYYSGTGVTDAYRLLTDGACMGRWNTDPRADGFSLAVLLDCSWSMYDQRPADCAGIADAFANGMADCAEVRTWTFASDVREVSGFARVKISGSTDTDGALHAASEWLKTREGERVIVCITDGMPNDPDTTMAECRAAQSHGIRIAAVMIGEDASALVATMPGAAIATAQDAYRLAIELESLGHQLESLSV